MRYSLINIASQDGARISGRWVQDHIGTLDTATQAARRTEAANSHKIQIGVVAAVVSTTPLYETYSNLERLD